MTVDPDRPCYHLTFMADVDVIRHPVDERTPTGEADAYMAEVTIRCAECAEPFTWVGPYHVGLLPYGPTIDPSAQELRAPIRPRSAEPDFGLGLPGFTVRVDQ